MPVATIAPEEMFQALGDATRLRLLRLLAATNGEACLCEFVDSLLEAEYKVSRHLKILREAGLIAVTKEGRWIYHRLVHEPPHRARLCRLVRELPDPAKQFSSDLKRFQRRMKLRDGGRCRIGIQIRELASCNG